MEGAAQVDSGRFQTMENQVCPKSKTRIPVASDKGLYGWHRIKKKKKNFDRRHVTQSSSSIVILIECLLRSRNFSLIWWFCLWNLVVLWVLVLWCEILVRVLLEQIDTDGLRRCVMKWSRFYCYFDLEVITKISCRIVQFIQCSEVTSTNVQMRMFNK